MSEVIKQNPETAESNQNLGGIGLVLRYHQLIENLVEAQIPAVHESSSDWGLNLAEVDLDGPDTESINVASARIEREKFLKEQVEKNAKTRVREYRTGHYIAVGAVAD